MANLYSFDETYQRIIDFDVNGMNAGIVNVRGGKNTIPMPELLSLEGKVAIVTGGARGLGFCIVNRLCEAGAKVVIADIAAEFAQAAIRFFETKNYTVKFIRTDVRYIPEIKAAVEFTVKELGKIDILVNNAAIFDERKLVTITEEQWDDAMDTNLKGVVFFTQQVVNQMIKQGHGGRIINVASIAGYAMEDGWLIQYVASKAGLIGISQSLNRELKPLGISVNCVAPGGMLTPGAMHMERFPRDDDANASHSPVSDPDEVARVIYMLATDVSSFMIGAVIPVDGGGRLYITE
jgi:NAD(P)-dependent dehydrogenase (short-subunit alcohol dehydrogenase family)